MGAYVAQEFLSEISSGPSNLYIDQNLQTEELFMNSFQMI